MPCPMRVPQRRAARPGENRHNVGTHSEHICQGGPVISISNVKNRDAVVMVVFR